jgi:hypothetical protein
MFLNRRIDVVTVERDDYGGVGCGRGESGREVFPVAFIDCLAKGDSGECDEVGIYGGVHEYGTSRAAGEKRLQNGWDFSFELTTGFDVLCAFDVSEGMVAQDVPRIDNDNDIEAGGRVPDETRLEFAGGGNGELCGEGEAKREGREQFHAVARVVPGVGPPDG